MDGARGRSGDAVEAREVRARAALENTRRIAIAERRDEIALHLRLVGEEGPVDRGVVETRHRPGIEPERARREQEIGALQTDRKGGGEGKSVSVRVNLGGGRIIKKKRQERDKQNKI